MDKRKEDISEKVLHYRSADRFVRVDGKWFFQAREGDHGPYNSREEAGRAAALFIASSEMKEAEEKKGVGKQHDPEEPPKAPNWELMVEPGSRQS